MLSTEEVKKIALLARIGLSEEEVEKYQKDLSTVLDWFAELKAADTEKIGESGHVSGLTNKAVEDKIVPASPLEREQIQKNMPDTKDGALKVRSVF